MADAVPELVGYVKEVSTISTSIRAPISPLLLLIHTAPLYIMAKAKGLQATGFFDNLIRKMGGIM